METDTNDPFAGLTYKEALARLVSDPGAHYALKQRVLEDQERDPVDSLNDAEVLCAVQRLRLDDLLRATPAR